MNYTYTDSFDSLGNKNGLWRSDGAYIPLNESNSDYQAYLRWLENPNADSGTIS